MTFFGWKPEAQHTGVYLLTCSLTYFIALAYHAYQKSPAGYLAGAIRENEIRVEYLGNSARKLLHFKYVIASIISALAGSAERARDRTRRPGDGLLDDVGRVRLHRHPRRHRSRRRALHRLDAVFARSAPMPTRSRRTPGR